MYVSSVSDATTSAAAATDSSTKTAQQTANFDGSDFMLLLLAQLKNQNPLEPMDDKDMMGQMTQMNSLQTLQSIQSTLEILTAGNQVSSAANLIGKTVKANVGEDEPLEGVVTGVTVEEGKIMISIGDETVPINAIIEISGGTAK